MCGEDLLDLGMSANQIRRSLHPENVVTYEVCGIVSSLEEAVSEAATHGGGHVNLAHVYDVAHVPLDALGTRMQIQRDRLPGVTFHHLPISTFHGSERTAIPLDATLRQLHAAGLRSISANFYPARPSALSHVELATFLQIAARCDLFVAASLTIGDSETFEQRVDTLTMLHDLQQDSRSIRVVQVRVHHAVTPETRREEEATAVDYLKTLAVTRIFLDNVEHLQTDWSVMGPKVLELALRFGADDAGSVPWSQAGSPEPSHHGGESELRRIIRDAGFRPVERDALFRQSLLH
jgi:cyclic dehypoxanthinyl futalosine synthase